LIDRIGFIIERHDSGKETDSLEEDMVKDADKLWRFSKEGALLEIERQHIDSEQWFRILSTNLETWFFTDTARKVAGEEFKRLKREIA
jgi:hypothetical protein